MVKILVVNLGPVKYLLPSTSILKKICKEEVTWVIKSEKSKNIFDYNTKVKRVFGFDEFKKIDETFDLLINLYPIFPHWKCKNLLIKSFFDYDFEREYKEIGKALFGEKSILNMNLFQIAYRLSGSIWGGEGYDLPYRPKTRSKSLRVGVAVAQSNLRAYINDNLDVGDKKLWHIPHKKNILRKMDEINRCQKVITDDLTTFHLAMALRKYVYFLETFPLNFKMEFFGNGELHKVPKNVFS